MASNIYIIGPLGAGKTAVGRYLARKLHCTFMDTDQEIATSAGADLNWIYDIEGEAGYRIREQQVIEKVSKQKNLVISTGGGAILTPANGQIMQTTGTIFYLSVSFEVQLQRTQLRRGTRPLLEDGNSIQESLQTLNAQRVPLYKSLAHFIIPTDEHSAFELATQIALILEKKQT